MGNSESFRCASCSKCFGTRSRYNQHLKTHSKPFSCQSCPKAFALRHDLNRHVQAKHRVGGRKFPCPYCQFKASRRDNLSHHLRNQHQSEAIESTVGHAIESATRAQGDSAQTTYGCSDLMQAAGAGNINMVEFFLEKGFPVSTTGDDGSTALHCAARAGQTATVEYLVHRGAPIEVQNDRLRTPLHEAVSSRTRTIVALLIRLGTNIRARDFKGRTPIHYSVQGDDVEITRLIIEHDGLPPDDLRHLLSTAIKLGYTSITRLLCSCLNTKIYGFQKWGLLHLAAKFGHEESMRVLLEVPTLGSDINEIIYKNGISWTPLKLAAKHGHESVLVLLLSSPDININSSSRSAFHFAMEFGHSSIARVLMEDERFKLKTLENDIGNEYLARAAGHGNLELVKMLFGLLDIEKNSTFQLMVPEIAWNGHSEVFEFLISHDGFKPKDEYIKEALFIAAMNGQRDFVEMLISYGNDAGMILEEVDQPWTRRMMDLGTVQFNIVDTQQSDITEVLINASLDEDIRQLNEILNREDIQPHTAAIQHALIEAVKGNKLQSVKKILSIQPEVSINFKGDWPCQTLLHIACLKDHEEIVKFLLQREDIDVNVTDIGGSTPLHLAACNGHTKIVRRLEKHDQIDLQKLTNQSYFGIPGPEKTAEELAKKYQQWRVYCLLPRRPTGSEAKDSLPQEMDPPKDDHDDKIQDSDTFTDEDSDEESATGQATTRS